MPGRPVVLKLGGSVLLDATRLRRAVHEIYRWRREGREVVAVVSAFAGRTDEILDRCMRLDPGLEPAGHRRLSPFALAAALGAGEAESAAFLGAQLDRAGVPATVLSPGAVGLRADGDPLDATPREVDTGPIERALERDGVVVFPGFVALDAAGRAVTLGRGGSDLTALFLAHALAADRCRLIKDVDAPLGPRMSSHACSTFQSHPPKQPSSLPNIPNTTLWAQSKWIWCGVLSNRGTSQFLPAAWGSMPMLWWLPTRSHTVNTGLDRSTTLAPLSGWHWEASPRSGPTSR
jgi:hypothetical protein